MSCITVLTIHLVGYFNLLFRSANQIISFVDAKPDQKRIHCTSADWSLQVLLYGYMQCNHCSSAIAGLLDGIYPATIAEDYIPPAAPAPTQYFLKIFIHFLN